MSESPIAPATPSTGTEAPRIRVLHPADEIAARVRSMGREIQRVYPEGTPLLIGVLKGAVMFHCDLARAMEIDVELDFLSISSYGREKSSGGQVRLLNDLRTDISGRHVLLCEGVVDSGRSVAFLLDLLRARHPASLRVATLLDKRPCREIDVPLDFVGWTAGAEFLVGYGLDAAERYRNLPYVGVLEEN